MTAFTSTVVVATLIGAASSAFAQQIQPPPRASGQPRNERPLDLTRDRQELSAEATLLGGYDDNLSPVTGLGPFAPRDSGYAGAGNGILRYFIGRARKSLEIDGRGFVNTYPDIGPVIGGGAVAIGEVPLSRRTTLNVSQGAQWLPFFTMNMFSPLRESLGVANPDSNPANGLVRTANEVTGTRSLVLDSQASVRQEWNRSFSTDGGYSYNSQTYSQSIAFDSRSHGAHLGVERTVARGTSIRTSYRYVDALFAEARGTELPMKDHIIELGVQRERDVSRTRRVSLSVRGGAQHTDTLDATQRTPLEYWTPTAFGSIQYDWARTWTVAADYQHSASVLNVSIVPQTFINHTATLRTGGYLNDRMEGSLVFGYANGHAGAEVNDTYDGYTGTAQLRVGLSDSWSSILAYNHHQYRLTRDASIFFDVPRQVHRNSLWLGLSWSAPLIRRYMRTGSR